MSEPDWMEFEWIYGKQCTQKGIWKEWWMVGYEMLIPNLPNSSKINSTGVVEVVRVTFPETNSSPLKISLPKRKVVSQPSFFRGNSLVSWRVVLVQTCYSLWCKPINLIFVHFPLGKGSSQPYRAWALHEVSLYKMMAQHLGYQTDGSSRKKKWGSQPSRCW